MRLYSDANYKGPNKQFFENNVSDLSTYQINDFTPEESRLNDKTSSLQVSSNCKVTLYEHSNYQGRSKTFWGDVPYVGDDFNDMASSFKAEVRCRAMLYEQPNYQGKAVELFDDAIELGSYGMNDKVRSIRVIQGCKAIAYEHYNYEGRSKGFANEISWIGDDFNIGISAIRFVKSNPAHCTVEFFRDWYYTGARYAYERSRPAFDSGFIKGAASSIRITPGCKVIVYKDEGYKGKSATYTSDVAWLDSWNDMISSFQISPIADS